MREFHGGRRAVEAHK